VEGLSAEQANHLYLQKHFWEEQTFGVMDSLLAV